MHRAARKRKELFSVDAADTNNSRNLFFKIQTHHVAIYLIMVALCNRADHYIFMMWFVLLSSSSFFLFFLA